MKFIKEFDISKVAPADYNPRKITEGAFEELQKSLKRFGVVKPVIMNKNGTLVAGHQRTKAMKSIGITHCPAFFLNTQVSLQDEIRFNLMHNSIETESSKIQIDDINDLDFGYSIIDPSQVIVNEIGKGAIIKEISKLIERYGEWGSVIVDEAGTVIHNSDYAYSSKILNKDVVVFKMESEKVESFRKYIDLNYGSYNYDTLGIKSYNQTHCQMNRGKSIGSTLYKNFVLPNLDMKKRLVDFGAGKMFYVNSLKEKGMSAFGYEPHFKKEGTEQLDVKQVVNHIFAIEKDVAKNGLYDIVVLDSVINSIVSNEFEDHVLTACNALMAKDGVFYTGTRNLKVINERLNQKQSADAARYIEFLDDENFSATFRKGVWTLQKFHDAESLEQLLSKYFDEVQVFDSKKTQIYAVCKKPKKLSLDHYTKSLNIEFNMEYPNGYHHNRQEKIVSTLMRELDLR